MQQDIYKELLLSLPFCTTTSTMMHIPWYNLHPPNPASYGDYYLVFMEILLVNTMKEGMNMVAAVS